MTIVDEDKVSAASVTHRAAVICVCYRPGHLCACVVQKMKHSKLAEGIEQSYVHNPQLLPAGIDADSVSSLLHYSTWILV